MNKIHPLIITGILFGLGIAFVFSCCLKAHAAELGHFYPSVPRVRDFVQPPEPGAYYMQYNTYYTTDTYKNRNGDEVDTVQVGSVTATVDIDVDSYMVSPTFVYLTDKDILGANYGFYIIQPFGDLALDAAITTNIDLGVSRSDSSFGLGDTFVQPLWLGWASDRNDAALGYGFYAPTGKYDFGKSDNVGLGYWSHQFQAAAAHYFMPEKASTLVGAVTYEINHNKDGADIRPGDRLTLNLGFDQMLPVSENFLGNVGLVGYGQWQVTEDNGSDARRRDVKDQIYGAGIEAGLTYLPWMGQASLKWVTEMEAEDRFEGDFFQATLAIPF